LFAFLNVEFFEGWRSQFSTWENLLRLDLGYTSHDLVAVTPELLALFV
jgi:hypothetical protein